MRLASRWLLRALALVAVIAALFAVDIAWLKPLRIGWFFGRVSWQNALADPEAMSGEALLPEWLNSAASELTDMSPAAVDRRYVLARDQLQTLERYDRASLVGEDRLSYDVLDWQLKTEIAGEPFRDHFFPLNQLFGIQSTLPAYMVGSHPLRDARDAKRYVERLRAFPEKFHGLLAAERVRLDKGIVPPDFTVAKVLRQMREFVAPTPRENVLYTHLRDRLAALPSIDAPTRDKILDNAAAAIEQSVYPAYAELIAWFEHDLTPRAQGGFGAWHLPNGEAYYRWCIRQHTTIDAEPEALHALGLSEVARISGEMDAILREHGLADGTVGARVDRLAHEPAQLYSDDDAGRAQILHDFQAIVDEMRVALPLAFADPPNVAVSVQRLPIHAEKTAPAAYYNEPAEDGTRPGTFFVNLRDVPAIARFAMRTLAYHESIPGHHLQITSAQLRGDLPLFRRTLGLTAYTEGWALYAEHLAHEMGFEQDPLDNLGRLRDEMLRAVRLVVDTGIHFKHWTREESIRYMLDNTGMAESDVVAEVERYFVYPGQALGFKVGMLKILELRAKAQAALGDRYDVRAFHSAVLDHGALPMPVLEQVVGDYIAGAAGR